MRDRIGIAIAGEILAVFQPVAHQRRIEPALDACDMAALDLEADLVLHIAAIGQDDDVAGLKDDPAGGTFLIGEGVEQADAPMVEAARLIGHAVLAHHGIFAAGIGEVGPGGAGDAAADCINNDTYAEMVAGMANAVGEYDCAKTGR